MSKTQRIYEKTQKSGGKQIDQTDRTNKYLENCDVKDFLDTFYVFSEGLSLWWSIFSHICYEISSKSRHWRKMSMTCLAQFPPRHLWGGAVSAAAVRCSCPIAQSQIIRYFRYQHSYPKCGGARVCRHLIIIFNIATQRATCPLRLDINFILRYYCLKARTHITAVITFSMTHFNALSTPVHWVQHRRCRVIVCRPGCSWWDLLDHIRCHHLDPSQWFGHLLCRCLSPAQIDGPMPSRGPIKLWIFFIKRH